MSFLLRLISNNFTVFLGIIIGLTVSSFISNAIITTSCYDNDDTPVHKTSDDINNQVGDSNVVIDAKQIKQAVKGNRPTNNARPTATATKQHRSSKIIRPRYYSTELGIREKLFVGIVTSEAKINTIVVHLNRTLGHLVDRIKFFMTAQYKLKARFNVSGLIGFTDTRHKYRPFQILKYVGDNFAQDFDYYFFTGDYTYVNARRLQDVVRSISVSMDVYLGTKVEDSSFCNLDSGIILSSSVLKAIREHLDWCVMNAVSDSHSENIGRCIHYSTGLTCQQSIQGAMLPTYKLKYFDLDPYLIDLSKQDEFNRAVTIYPVLQSDSLYILNSYFLRQRLSLNMAKIAQLSANLTDSWPPGQKIAATPATRFDLPRQLYFNMTHMFFPDDFTQIARHKEADRLDIDNILVEILDRCRNDNDSTGKYQFRRLVNGYRTFDLSKGMDYVLDLGFRDLTTGKEVIRRFEVSKPLGKVELVPVPYVTENTRVTIILPIQESEIKEAMTFLNGYLSAILTNPKDKNFLMLVFLYQFNTTTTSKGKDDPFDEIKSYATSQIATKYHHNNDDFKVGTVSIRLPSQVNRSIEYAHNTVLSFAIIDLALKKIGLDSLVLVLDVYSDITTDFLNRVRMNTILNFQIFSPIPFRQYNPKISQTSHLEVNKNVGHFDREEYRYISFYGKDYVQARKKFQSQLPIVKVDNDIATILHDQYQQHVGNVFEMFLNYGDDNIHCMRATEMNLRIRYHDASEGRCHWFLGSEIQLAKLLLTKQHEITSLPS